MYRAYISKRKAGFEKFIVKPPKCIWTKSKWCQRLLVMFRRFSLPFNPDICKLALTSEVLNVSCSVVGTGRTLLRRLIDLTLGISRPQYHIRLTRQVKLNLLTGNPERF